MAKIDNPILYKGKIHSVTCFPKKREKKKTIQFIWKSIVRS